MDLAEAKLIADIVGTADGGCPCCVDDLVGHLNKSFPAFRWERTRDDRMGQPDWSNGHDDAIRLGYVVEVEPNPAARQPKP